MTILKTERLILRRLTMEDAEFLVDLLNQPSFLRYIGDRGVRTVEDAERFLREGPLASYEEHGFGLLLVASRESGEPMGMCGLLRRDGLDDVDVGFAFLPDYWSRGYGYEAASAVLDHGYRVLGLERIVAIVSPDNQRSFKLLEKLGLRFERWIRLAEDEPEIQLFAPATPAAGDAAARVE